MCMSGWRLNFSSAVAVWSNHFDLYLDAECSP
jgi:hypothetical protein